MDRLEQMMQIQQQLNNKIIEKRSLQNISQEVWIQRHSLALISELAEMLDEVNFKWWKNPKPIQQAALKEELVDILHFFLSMCLAAGMDANEMFEIYLAKNKENVDRMEGRSKKPGYNIHQD